MHPDDPRRFALILPLAFPVIGWFFSAWYMQWLRPDAGYIVRLIVATPRSFPLYAGAIAGLAIGLALLVAIVKLAKPTFTGAPYARFVRGIRLMTAKELSAKTKETGKPVTVAGIPIPTKTQSLHFLIGGSTGTGKSVLLSEMALSAKMVGQRAVIFDSNGDLYSKFGMPRDKILNPFDARSEGWSIFNEIIDPEIDIPKLVSNLIPSGADPKDEFWRRQARSMTTALMSKLYSVGDLDMGALVHWATEADLAMLGTMLAGTPAASLMSGADDSVKGIRFTMADYLPGHLAMPQGPFSIRQWINDPDGGDLYITRQKATKAATKALVSTWADLVCSYTLTRTQSQVAPLWMFADELADMDKLSNLVEAQTEGRKSGLHIVASLQSLSQIEKIYGDKDAQTLLSCFGSAIVLGGGAADDKMNERMSKAIGHHEVERVKKSRNSGKSGTSTSVERQIEPLVMPAEIASMPELQCYVRFARTDIAAKARLVPVDYKVRNEPFVRRSGQPC